MMPLRQYIYIAWHPRTFTRHVWQRDPVSLALPVWPFGSLEISFPQISF